MKKKSTNPSSTSTTRLQIKKDPKSFEITFLHNKFAAQDKNQSDAEQTSTSHSLQPLPSSRKIISQKEPRQASPTPTHLKPSIAKQIFLLFTFTPFLAPIVTILFQWLVTTHLANSLGLKMPQDQINMVIEKIIDIILQNKG